MVNISQVEMCHKTPIVFGMDPCEFYLALDGSLLKGAGEKG